MLPLRRNPRANSKHRTPSVCMSLFRRLAQSSLYLNTHTHIIKLTLKGINALTHSFTDSLTRSTYRLHVASRFTDGGKDTFPLVSCVCVVWMRMQESMHSHTHVCFILCKFFFSFNFPLLSFSNLLLLLCVCCTLKRMHVAIASMSCHYLYFPHFQNFIP